MLKREYEISLLEPYKQHTEWVKFCYEYFNKHFNDNVKYGKNGTDLICGNDIKILCIFSMYREKVIINDYNNTMIITNSYKCETNIEKVFTFWNFIKNDEIDYDYLMLNSIQKKCLNYVYDYIDKNISVVIEDSDDEIEDNEMNNETNSEIEIINIIIPPLIGKTLIIYHLLNYFKGRAIIIIPNNIEYFQKLFDTTSVVTVDNIDTIKDNNYTTVFYYKTLYDKKIKCNRIIQCLDDDNNCEIGHTNIFKTLMIVMIYTHNMKLKNIMILMI